MTRVATLPTQSVAIARIKQNECTDAHGFTDSVTIARMRRQRWVCSSSTLFPFPGSIKYLSSFNYVLYLFILSCWCGPNRLSSSQKVENSWWNVSLRYFRHSCSCNHSREQNSLDSKTELLVTFGQVFQLKLFWTENPLLALVVKHSGRFHFWRSFRREKSDKVLWKRFRLLVGMFFFESTGSLR